MPTKPSRFNVAFDTPDGGRLAFNAAAASLVRIRAEKLPAFEHALRSRGEGLEGEARAFHDTLLEQGFVVDEGVDELRRLEVEALRARFGRRTLSLTIAPTLACNFRCDYCYERASAARMDADTERAVVAFAAREMAGAERVRIAWFGGEPTLALGAIERIGRAIAAEADARGVVVEPAGIVTNGYALDARAATRLVAAGVRSAQVTLDGPARVHDARRSLAGGGPTFETIVANLAEVSGLLRCSVRVNLDARNADDAVDLVAELAWRGLVPGVDVHFAPVNESGAACRDIGDHCLSAEAFARVRVDVARRLAELGMDVADYPAPLGGGHCQAGCDAGYVIAPDGLLFACWELIADGEAASIGSVFHDPTPAQRANRERYLSWDPLRVAECRACTLLPLCMGGCPREALAAGAPVCSTWKYALEDMLSLK